jgi:hypothetical protein
MSVSVAGRLVPRSTALSDSARFVLGLIEGGVEWLTWAILHPRARYHFASEEDLVGAVQVGLHGWRLLLMRDIHLLVGPAKLMTLHRRHLRTLIEAKTCTGRVAEILQRYRLVTQTELAGDAAALSNLVGGKPLPVLQGMAFDDQLEIHALLKPDRQLRAAERDEEFWEDEDDEILPEIDDDEPLPEGDRKEAALFAAERAVTPREFADYFRAYVFYVEADHAHRHRHGPRKPNVDEAMDVLLPLLFDALDCPTVGTAVAPWEVAEAIGDWVAMGRLLGFSRRSQLAEQVIAHTAFARRDCDDPAPRIVAAYLAGAQALVASGDLGRRRLGQDGISSSFRIRSEAEEAVVTLGRQGVISLAAFGPRRHRAAPPKTEGGKDGKGHKP